MVVFSYSRIASFFSCPRKYMFAYIKRVPREERVKTSAQVLGTSVHAALEYYYKEKMRNIEHTVEDVLRFYETIWEREWDGSIYIPQGTTEENEKEIGRQCLINYFEKIMRDNIYRDEKILGVEKNLYFPIDDNNSIRCIIDRLGKIDTEYIIHDYKTGGRLPDIRNLEQDEQLILYAAALRYNIPDAKDIKLVWHFVRFGEDFVIKPNLSRISEVLEAIREKIKKIESAVEKQEFPPVRGVLCNYCDFKKYCDSYDRQLTLEEHFSQDDISRYLSLIEEKKALRKKLKDIEEDIQKIEGKIIERLNKEDKQYIIFNDKRISYLRKKTYILPAQNSEKRRILEDILNTHNIYNRVAVLNPRKLISFVEGLDDNFLKNQILSNLVEKEQEKIRVESLGVSDRQ